jgi:poly(A) polymerase
MTAVRFLLETPVLQAAAGIVETLRQRGFAAYFVGGCVRDLVMGREPKDADIATSATPDEVQEIFSNTVAVGAQFGVVIVIEGGIHFEVSTFRSDAAYGDGRHPDSVRFAATPEEDARRRDFTINALFYDPLEGELLDFHGGRRDIERKNIRAIGNARERFNEDKLRLLRAVRFAVRFESEIEAATRQAIEECAPQIHQVSAERVRDELTRILTEGHSHRGFMLLDELGLLKEVLPELVAMKGVEQPPEFHPEGDVWVHTMLLLKLMDEQKQVLGDRWRVTENNVRNPQTCSPPNAYQLQPATYPSDILAWAALLHDVGKPATFERADRIRFNNHTDEGAKLARHIARRLRMSSEDTDAIVELVQEHLKFKDVRRMRPSTLKRFVRRKYFAEHLELHRLDCLASHGLLDEYQFTLNFAQALTPEETRPKPLLNGQDLIDLGYPPGPLFKEIITTLEDAQLDNQIADREAALEFLRRNFPIPR